MGAGAFPIPGPNATPFSGSRGEKAKRLLWLCLPMGGREAFHLSKGVAPLDAGGPFPPPCPNAPPFSGPGTKVPRTCPGFASRWAGKRLSTFQKASPRWARRSFSAPARRLALFGSRGNEGTECLHGFCLPMGGRNAFRLSKGVAPLGVGGSFPALGPDASPFSGPGTKGPRTCPGFASRWAGETLSVFQKASPRRARGGLSRPAPTPRPFRGPGTKEPNARPRLSRPRPDAPPFTGPGGRRSRTSARAGLRPRGAGAPAGRAGCTPPSRRCRPAGRRG